MTHLRIAEHFIIFPNKFNKFNNTEAIKLLQNGIFGVKMLRFCQNLVVYQFSCIVLCHFQTEPSYDKVFSATCCKQ